MQLHTPWLDALPYRACELCTSGHSQDGRRICRSPRIAADAAGVAVELMRSKSGPCGPDARFLEFPGLSPQ